jgi:branched-chain amino acid transport system ATP-binding protein
MSTLLELKNITVRYGMAEAVSGVSLDLADGEIITLIGANGAGKSTILKTISGVKKPTTGEIWFRGERIDKLSPEKIVARGIAHVPERRRIFPYMSVHDNLKAGAYLRKDSEIGPDLENVFHHFSLLKQRLGQMAGTLSGGEQRMVELGRVLMTKPKMIVVDEFSTGLSPKIYKEFLLPHYKRVTGFLDKNKIDRIMIDSDGNINPILDMIVEAGITGTWPLEVNAGMNAITVRQKYGNKLFLAGNLDKAELMKGGDDMKKEVDSKVPALKELGGYVPGADHLIPVEMNLTRFREYAEYMKKLL